MFQTLKLCSYLEPHKLCLYPGIEIYLVYSHIFRLVFVKYNPNYTGRPLRGPGIIRVIDKVGCGKLIAAEKSCFV